MDFSPGLLALQGCLMCADNDTPFDRLTSRGGNEENLLCIVESLRKFLKDKLYISSEGISEKMNSEMQKFCFYLILNSDFTALQEIVEMPNIGHIVCTSPTISKCLLCEIVWGLGMEEHIAEIISYGNSKLAVQTLKAFVNSIRYLSPEDSINKVYLLSVASYKALCRMNFFEYDNSVLSEMLTELFDNFLRCITCFVSPPNNGKLELLRKFDQYTHLGRAFRSLLAATLTCLEQFQSPLVFQLDGSSALYSSTINTDLIKARLPTAPCESDNVPILEYLQKSNVALLDKCVELVMKVSVDVFCCWSEQEVNGISLQRIIGELCYKLNSKISVMKDLSEHTLLGMLPQLSSKPTDIFDIINQADDFTLIKNAYEDSKEKELWLNAIIERSNLYVGEELMLCLLSNLQYLREDVCEQIFLQSLKHIQQMNIDDPKNPTAELLVARSFVRVDSFKKLELIRNLVFTDGIFHNSLKTPTFEDDATEVFNKVISTKDASFFEVYDVFLQNPQSIYMKILTSGVENLQQADTMVKVLRMLKPLSEYCYANEKESAILKAIKELCNMTLESEVKQNSFVSLISGIKSEGVIPGEILFHQIIMPYIHKTIVNRDLSILKLHIRLLKQAYEVEELVQHRAPLLAMLANLLDILRWNLSTYVAEAPDALQEIIDLQASIFKTYGQEIPARELNWLKTKLKKLKPLNMYYYRTPPGQDFIEIITDGEKVEMDKYPLLLAKILSCCTRKEWFMTWQSLVAGGDRTLALELLCEALRVMAATEAQHRCQSSRLCIKYCYRNFTVIVKDQYLSEEQSGTYIESILQKIITLSNATSDDDIEDIGAIMLPLVAALADRKHHMKDVTSAEITNKLKHGKFAKLVGEVFLNATI